ncbi:LysM peptidoglycan-binding domain-containing protein [Candidatus Curtissbacteria bacterium]|nr:LysM peptidoglycan-binding domain-containing protein [Candidatus Curtissbacteria bacterium]
MARRRSTVARLNKLFFKDINWQESYAGLILGAIIVVVLGLLVANYFTRKNSEPAKGVETIQTEEEDQQKTQSLEYKVVAGDSLSLISQKYYGTFDFWPVLASVNKISNSNLIYVDTTLTIPPKAEVDEKMKFLGATSYRVQEGETFFSIAQKVYGDGSRWPILHQANGSLRLPNGNPLVFAGSTIVVPR